MPVTIPPNWLICSSKMRPDLKKDIRPDDGSFETGTYNQMAWSRADSNYSATKVPIHCQLFLAKFMKNLYISRQKNPNYLITWVFLWSHWYDHMVLWVFFVKKLYGSHRIYLVIRSYKKKIFLKILHELIKKSLLDEIDMYLFFLKI
jgi:hypothetical protein